MPRTVRDPNGDQWRVRRRWLARPLRRPQVGLRRGRKRGSGSADLGWLDFGSGGGDILGYIALAILVVIVVVILVIFVWPLLVALVDAIFLLLAAGAGLLGRIAFGRPWTVEAVRTTGVGERRAWRVVGWRRSGRVIEEVADALARGELQPRPADAVAA